MVTNRRMKKWFDILRREPGCVMAVNFLLMMVIYMLMRWLFYYMNMRHFANVTFNDMMLMSWGGLRFDLSALCYLNSLCVLLQFLPIKSRNTVRYQRVVKILFLVVNMLGVAVNAADIVYFEFGGRRTTWLIFSEFGGESNLGKIFLNSITGYWKVWISGIVLILAMIFLYYNPIKKDRAKNDYPKAKVYYPIHTMVFIIALLLTLGGLRGGFSFKMHPLRQDSADIYCKKPIEAAIVLNTPFTLITTAHKKGYKDPQFFKPEQLDAIFDPVKNKTFLDSLMRESYCFEFSFANGSRSVDCMPASFAGIPRYIDPYCYYAYSNNTLQGLPEMLKNEGYATAFFHGAPNNTLGFKGFSNSIGFEQYYGMDEYGNKDFDGTWAIFDEPYLQYFASKTNEYAKQSKPFFLTVFTASSHEPFRVPDEYKDKFTRGEIPMHRVISYSDYSIKRYFDKVKDEPWFKNTIFVFTADHCGVSPFLTTIRRGTPQG